MNEKKIKKSITEYCKNPFWKELYDNAPSEECKRYVALGFYYSDNVVNISDYEEYKAERERRCVKCLFGTICTRQRNL